MQKKNKVRFSVSIPHEVYEALDRFTRATGATKSGFIGEVLTEQVETLHRLADAMERAKNGEKDVALEDLNQLKMDFKKSVSED